MKQELKYLPMLVLTALIWGAAFVAQSVGNEYVGPFTFNSVRSLLGGAVLQPLIPLLGRLSGNRREGDAPFDQKNLWVGGVLCGVILGLASSLQQWALQYAGVGKAVAEYFISLGMKAGDEVIVFEGDTSSVTADRDAGFTDYLKEQGWTEDDLAKITFSGAMNWSRSAAKEYFESLMSDSKNASIKWFYSQDDEFAMGIMEALKGSAIDDATKQAILDNKIVISAAGGSENLYKIMRGEDAEYADLFASFGGLAVATYSPAMIQDAVELMVAYLNGEEITKDYVVPVEIVTSENVADYVGFN